MKEDLSCGQNLWLNSAKPIFGSQAPEKRPGARRNLRVLLQCRGFRRHTKRNWLKDGVAENDKDGPPSITVSALSRDTSSSEGFDFPFVEGFVFALAVFSAHRPRPALRITQWKLVPLTIYPVSELLTMIRCSDSPTVLREARRPISPTMNYFFTRVAHGLPCMRTSCA